MKRLRWILTAPALISGLAAIALTLSPGPLYATGALELMSAFSLLLDAAPVAAVAALVLGIAGAITGVQGRAWRATAIAVAAALTGGGIWLIVDDFKSRAEANPLHDVTTNLDTPPSFSAIAPRRYTEGDNAARAAYPHPDWRSNHAAVYPDLQTLVLPVDVSEAANRAKEVAAALGWTLQASEETEASARFEATDKTGWFGFTDDIVVTIASREEGGTLVDMRSVSQIGIGDVGKNAERIREFISRLQKPS